LISQTTAVNEKEAVKLSLQKNFRKTIDRFTKYKSPHDLYEELKTGKKATAKPVVN